jgi:uncharacterized protein (TIGR02246 family)
MFRKLAVIWFISSLLYGCALTQSVKEAISPDREAIKALVMKYQDAWNKHDPDEYMALFHSEAKIMNGAQRRFVSKMEYYRLLPQRFRDSPTLKIEGDQEIRIERDTAEVTFTASFPPTETKGIPYTLYLVRESGQWLIMKQEY